MSFAGGLTSMWLPSFAPMHPGMQAIFSKPSATHSFVTMMPLYKGRCQPAQNSGDTPDHFPDSVVTDIKPVRNVPDAREITQIPQRYKKVFFWCYTRSTSCGRWVFWEFALVFVIDCCQSCFKRGAGHPEMAAKII